MPQATPRSRRCHLPVAGFRSPVACSNRAQGSPVLGLCPWPSPFPPHSCPALPLLAEFGLYWPAGCGVRNMDARSGKHRWAWGLATLALALWGAGCATGGDTTQADVPGHDADVGEGGDVPCPDACPPGQSCIGGRCVPSSCTDGCPAGQTCCGSVCTSTRNDPANCGACGTICAPHGDTCLAGTCSCNGAAACSIERSCCPGLGCIDTMGDPTHCGGCTAVCEPDVECLAGACGGSCVTGCPDVPHGQTACAGEGCALATCDEAGRTSTESWATVASVRW